MAISATIYKVNMNVADMDRHVYLDGQHTVACHPSETLQRFMLRVLAWGLNADPELQFTKGVSSAEEPDLWTKNLVDEIELWVELGLPDEKRIRKASHRAKKVIVYAYGDHAAPVWWQANKTKINALSNVSVVFIRDEELKSLETLVERSMQLQLTIESEQAWLSDQHGTSIAILPEWWQR
ncbi:MULTISPECIES: YaeQ family protein [Photobacterium]|uniref:YaeQ protein n=1 Tax=Photobacterium piscicola TaxID=1378299 RepID=A0A1T5HVZ7_9GAMM|nr:MULTISPECIES: YaeQ family protein [Photobacterium]MEC6908703.1 YaeQ family protein [Photobacterium piscicola]PST94157.1 hypothetical protein C9I86_02020 [Photobacterium sp. NCIMB 13483]SKC31027.1 YaeQ protein [Photobacterium piscicola]